MRGRNGYIQVEIKGKMALCHIYPPMDDGEYIDFSEAENYLSSHGFKGYDKTKFRQLMSTGEEEVLSLGLCDGLDFSESMSIKVSLDRMKAICRFFPPSMNGNVMTASDILAQLDEKGIKFGIDQDAILDYLGNRQYGVDYIFANGKQPDMGRDAKIEYYFNTNPNLRPKYNEDGSVNYRELNTINEVYEGQLLAKLIPADTGAPGRDIFGNDIPTRKVNSKRLHYGKNIRISEDNTQLYSEVQGHVKLVDEQVFVSDVYEVPADVDNSTGNIEFPGSVHVAGNVRGGFSIISQGDVIVDGVVEDALIQAGGQVVIKQGIHGMQRGLIDAQGNVICQFIENAKVYSGGYVETGSIIFSEVNATQDVIVNDHKGFIAGGIIRAGGKVESHILGSSMGAITRVEVGMAPEKKEQYLMLQKDISTKNQRINKLVPVIKTYQDYAAEGKELDQKNIDYLNKIMDEVSTLRGDLQKEREVFNGLHQELMTSQHAMVVVRRDVYPGVTIVISDLSKTIRDKRSYCQFKKEQGEIQVSNL